jgi:geranylgeranyl diphosphate synthase type I
MQQPAAFDRYLPDFAHALRDELAGQDLPLYDMVRYHLGWQDEAGGPVDADPGKVLRPMLCLLACETAGGDYRKALPAAVAVELLHNFSLIHDDIQDRDRTRRGRPTVWAIWGEAQAINAGDVLWAIANRALAGATDAGWTAEAVVSALKALNEAAVRMIEGQYMDLSSEASAEVSVESYQEMTVRKTGALFGCALELGAIAAGMPNETALTFRRCGERLGLAFQIHDDVLGVWGDPAVTGKSVDSDIVRRKKTLLVVHAVEHGSEEDRRVLLDQYFGPGHDPDVVQVRSILDRSGSREYAGELAAGLATEAFAELDQLELDADAHAELKRVARGLLSRER